MTVCTSLAVGYRLARISALVESLLMPGSSFSFNVSGCPLTVALGQTVNQRLLTRVSRESTYARAGSSKYLLIQGNNQNASNSWDDNNSCSGGTITLMRR